MRVTASLGLGRAYPGGSVAEDFPMNDLTSPMPALRVDFGVRIVPKVMVALVADAAGGGTPGLGFRTDCSIGGVDCAVSSFRIALEGRYVATPEAEQTWWAGAGLGSEATRVHVKDSNDTRDYLPTYTGGIFPRLSGGWDRRISRYWGWGLYGALSFGRYEKIAFGDSDTTADVPGDRAGHSWLDLGVRFILFP